MFNEDEEEENTVNSHWQLHRCFFDVQYFMDNYYYYELSQEYTPMATFAVIVVAVINTFSSFYCRCRTACFCLSHDIHQPHSNHMYVRSFVWMYKLYNYYMGSMNQYFPIELWIRELRILTKLNIQLTHLPRLPSKIAVLDSAMANSTHKWRGRNRQKVNKNNIKWKIWTEQFIQI